MKSFVAPALIALLAAATAPALAQDASVSLETSASAEVSAGSSVEAGGMSADMSAPSAVGGANNGPLDAQITTDNTYASLIAAINANEAVDLSGVTDESKVSIVLVSTLEGDAATEATALDAAVTAQAAGLTTLRENATANAVISAKLTAEGHSVEDVVAIRADANGNTLVYVDDRA